MADFISQDRRMVGGTPPIKYHDNGDGTFSLLTTANGLGPHGSATGVDSVIVAGGTFKGWMTIKNTDTTSNLFLKFGAAATTSDFYLEPGASITLPAGMLNALHGLSSGSSTAFATIGF